MTPEKAEKLVNELLDGEYWLPTLKTDYSYQRLHDYHDGTMKGTLNVQIDKMDDVWVATVGEHMPESLRFRTWGGGGMSLKVRKALCILAEAIRQDNEESNK